MTSKFITLKRRTVNTGPFRWFLYTMVLLLCGMQGFAQSTATSRASSAWNVDATWSLSRTGTITTSSVSTIVTGTGTSFLTELSVGQVITTSADVLIGTIQSITNNTTLVLTVSAATTNTAIAYAARRVPVSADNVVISGAFTVTVTANAACNTLTYATASNTARVVTLVGTSSLVIAGALSMDNTGRGNTMTLNINAGSVSAASLAMLGGGNSGGTVTATVTTGSLSITNAVTMSLAAAANTIDVGTGIFNAGSVSIDGASTPSGEIKASTGTMNISGSIAFTGVAIHSKLTFTGNGVLNLGGNLGAGGLFTPGTSTVNMNGTTQVINGAYSYNNLTIKSTSTTTGTGISTVSGNFTIENTGTYIQNNLGTPSTTIFAGTEIFGASSNFKINSWTSTATILTTGVTLPFGNLEINWNSGGTWSQSLSGTVNLTTGNFTITTLGLLATEFRLTPATTGAALNISIGGNLSVATGTLVLVGGGSAGTKACTLNVSGDVAITGIIDLNSNTASSGDVNFNIGSNLSVTGSGVLKNTTGSGVRAVNFNKATGNQTFSSTATGINTSAITFNVGTAATTNSLQLLSSFIMAPTASLSVLNNATLDCGINIVQATVAGTQGNFTLNSGATLKIGSTAGITTSGATGNIQTATTRSFSSTANYIYNSTVLSIQSTGNALTAANNLEISNTSGVSLTSNAAISGIFILTAGNLDCGANTLTVNNSAPASIVRTSGHVIGNLQRAIASGVNTYTFTVGTSSGYSPATFNFATGTGSGLLTASATIPNAAPAAGVPPTGSNISQSKYINRFWRITNNSVTTPSYSATFTYLNPADIIGGANTSSLIVAKNSSGTWSNPGVSSSVAPSVTTVGGLTSFGDFYLGEIGCIAPTGLTYTSNTVVICENVAISTNSPSFAGDAATSYSVSPALPTGLNLNTVTGNITGTATVPAAAANYTITVNNACGSTTKVLNITVNAATTLTLTSDPGSNNQAACNGTAIGTITYAVGGGATGAGATGLPAGVTGIYNTGVFTITGTPASAGTYNYSVTTTGGNCTSATATGTIISNAAPTLGIVKTNVSQCVNNNGSITVTPIGGVAPYNYAWTGIIGSGNPATTPYPNPGNVSSISGLTIGYYNVSVTDQNGCPVTVSNIHVEYAYLVYITNSGSSSSACGNTGSIILYGNAGVLPYTYSLDGVNYQSNNTFTNLAAATYTAHVKDASGCESTKSITVAAAAAIVVSPNVVGTSSCANDGSIQIFRTGGFPPYSYSLTSVSGPWQLSNSFSGLASGAYTAYVKDAAGCTGQQAVTVTQGAGLTVTASKTNTSTCVFDGTIQASVAGGVAPFTFSKDGGTTFQPGNSFTGLPQGNYVIIAKDVKGCTGSVNVTINLNSMAVTSYVTNASSCASSNGSIQLFRTGGTGPYSYSLDGNTYQPGSLFSGLVPGTYDGYVKDSKTCLAVQTGIVVGPSCPAPVTFNATNRSIQSSVKIPVNGMFKVSAYPNPSNTSFILVLSGNTTDKVSITVTDLLGRKVYQAQGNSKLQYEFGNNFKAGIYNLQVIQGANNQSIKLVKE